MILADENIDIRMIERLRHAGFDVYSIYESAPGIDDLSVIELSRNPPRIILTEDKDFGEWVFAHHIRNISVLFLRYHFKDTEAITGLLIELLTNRTKLLFEHFTTVTIQKIRIRPL